MICEIANRGRGAPLPWRVGGPDWSPAAGTRPVVRVIRVATVVRVANR
ncbi:hypothetical protein ABTE26_20250 [Acinetobacter baumannii]